MKTCIVFYSWQSDSPNATNRAFIEKALENAAKSIIADDSIQIDPVIERDTSGVPGAPDIAATILAKIEQSQIFVCDVTIINQKSDPKPMPNPNVLIELGYAMKTLGPQRIIMVMNSAFGGPELLPFDLRLKRVTVYHLTPEESERTSERSKLVSQLEQGLRTIMADLNSQSQIIKPERQPIEDQVIEAIENSLPNKMTLAKKFMPWWLTQIEQVAPPFPDEPAESESDDLLVNGLAQTIQLLYKYSQLAETIAVSDTTSETAQTIYKSFEQVIGRYSLPLGFSGRFRDTKFDFYKFIGHEIFVTFFSYSRKPMGSDYRPS